MTTKIIKKANRYIVLLLACTLLLSMFRGSSVSADATTVELAKQRAILWNFSNCIVKTGDRDSSVIDTNRGYFGSWDDPIGDWMDDRNYIVGFDIDPSNGTMSCLDIIPLGINTLIDRGVSIPQSNGKIPISTSTETKAQKTAITEWLGKYVVNKTFAEMEGQRINYKSDVFVSKLRDLKSLSDKEISKIGPLNAAMIQRKYYDLFNICYRAESSGNGELDTGKGDFKGPDGHYYYIRSRDEIKPLIIGTFIRDGGDDIDTGSDHNYRLDDIVLEFHSFSTGFSDAQVFEPLTSNFYPLGSDVPPFTKAGSKEGIAECSMIQKNVDIQKAILSTGILISGGKITYTSDNPNAQIPGSATTNNGSGAAEEEPTCETSGNPLGWITCGVINGLSSLVQGIFTAIIEPYLKASPVDTTPSSENDIFKVWSSLRNIANIILIFALLFVVFGQAIGGGLVDAYTAKKIMPRLLAAAILVNVSIYLVAIMIDLFNVIGAGIGNLILGPFKNTIYRNFSGDSGGAATFGAVLAGAAVVLIGFVIRYAFKHSVPGDGTFMFWHFVLVFVLVPAALITLAVFATLIIRQGIILVLIVTAPIAFALFAIPNTEKYFKKWWDAFVATLMVYPIMTVIFAVSLIMASISYNASNALDGPSVTNAVASVIGVLVALVIFIIPLALIPFSFKIAGNLMGTLLGSVKGVSDRAGKLGKGRYNERRGMVRKALFEEQWRNKGTREQMAIARRKSGRTALGNRIVGWSTRRGGGTTDTTTPEAIAAGDMAEAAALSSSAPESMAVAARTAAISAYTSALARGHDAATAGAAATHAGRVAATGASPAFAASVGAAAATAYSQSINTYAGDQQTASVAAQAAANAQMTPRVTAQAVSASAREAARVYRAGGRTPAAEEAAQSAGRVAQMSYQSALDRNGGDHAAAAAEVQGIVDTTHTIRQQIIANNTSPHAHEASDTAAMAAAEALAYRDDTGAALSGNDLRRVVDAATLSHISSMNSGGDTAAARQAAMNAARGIYTP